MSHIKGVSHDRKVLEKAQLVSDCSVSVSRANSLTPGDRAITTPTTANTMPSVSHAVGNLYHFIVEILGGLLNSILTVFQRIVAFAINTVEAFFTILRVLFTRIVDLMSSAVGFVIGASTVQASSFPLQLIIYSSCACRQHLHSYSPWCCVLVLRDANTARTGDSSKRPGQVEAVDSHWQCRIMSIMSIISIISIIIMPSDS